MTAPAAEPRPDGLPLADADAPALDVVIPVHNEEVDLAGSVARVHEHLARLPYTFRITIADNASTDGTALVAHRLSHEYDEVRAVYLPEKGRGRALKQVWSASEVAGARLHGRRPVHGPERAAPAGRPAALRALGPGDRQPADPGVADTARARSGS